MPENAGRPRIPRAAVLNVTDGDDAPTTIVWDGTAWRKVTDLLDERDRLAAQITRIRERHQPNEHGNCANRCYTSGLAPQPSPCPTLRDLDGAE